LLLTAGYAEAAAPQWLPLSPLMVTHLTPMLMSFAHASCNLNMVPHAYQLQAPLLSRTVPCQGRWHVCVSGMFDRLVCSKATATNQAPCGAGAPSAAMRLRSPCNISQLQARDEEAASALPLFVPAGCWRSRRRFSGGAGAAQGTPQRAPHKAGQEGGRTTGWHMLHHAPRG